MKGGEWQLSQQGNEKKMLVSSSIWNVKGKRKGGIND